MIWDVSLRPAPLSRIGLTLKLIVQYSEFDSILQLSQQNRASALPLHVNFRLYLNIFRGEPAISEFVRHIPPNHISSQVIDTTTGSGLPHDVSRGSPWTWIAHSVSGLSHPLNRAINPRFHYASATKWLKQKGCGNSPVHSSIGTRSYALRAR